MESGSIGQPTKTFDELCLLRSISKLKELQAKESALAILIPILKQQSEKAEKAYNKAVEAKERAEIDVERLKAECDATEDTVWLVENLDEVRDNIQRLKVEIEARTLNANGGNSPIVRKRKREMSVHQVRKILPDLEHRIKLLY